MKKLEGESGSQHLKFALTETGDALLPVFAERIAWAGSRDKDPTVPAGDLNLIKTDRASIQVQALREMHNSMEGN